MSSVDAVPLPLGSDMSSQDHEAIFVQQYSYKRLAYVCKSKANILLYLQGVAHVVVTYYKIPWKISPIKRFIISAFWPTCVRSIVIWVPHYVQTILESTTSQLCHWCCFFGHYLAKGAIKSSLIFCCMNLQGYACDESKILECS